MRPRPPPEKSQIISRTSNVLQCMDSDTCCRGIYNAWLTHLRLPHDTIESINSTPVHPRVSWLARFWCRDTREIVPDNKFESDVEGPWLMECPVTFMIQIYEVVEMSGYAMVKKLRCVSAHPMSEPQTQVMERTTRSRRNDSGKHREQAGGSLLNVSLQAVKCCSSS
ncbi:hypothetical protein MRB53_041760 [Persea americana]|nr:hypothetical protein MRB53_041760 [Persea americana]